MSDVDKHKPYGSGDGRGYGDGDGSGDGQRLFIQNPHFASIRLETYACDIERLQFVLKNAGYEIDNTAYKNSFMIKW